MKKTLLIPALAAVFVGSAMAQAREPAMAKRPPREGPAAPGYIPALPSNTTQDKHLKTLEAEEKKAYQPTPATTPASQDSTKRR